MIDSVIVERALNIAVTSHAYQMDKGGHPYIHHVLRVYDSVAHAHPFNKNAQAVALLHDVVEDTDWTLNDLRRYFDEEIIIAIDAVTRKGVHTPDVERYWSYINRICENELARIVKYWDIKDNMDLTRVQHDEEATKTVESLIEKRYNKALRLIEERMDE